MTAAYDERLSRVQLYGFGLPATATSATIERSTNGVRWTTVRGASRLVPSPELLVTVDDFEFSADVLNLYRVRAFNGSGTQVATASVEITPTIGGVWLKSIARPFLNRRVDVRDFSDVQRPSRSGVFDVIGRSFPVAVTDVRASKRWTLDVYVRTAEETSDLALLLASGDILFVQVPATGRLSVVPSGYVAAGDTVERLLPTHDLSLRVVSMPLTEVAAPAADVVGATSNWQTVLNSYSTWEELLSAHFSWENLLELVGDPTDVIVP
ncbi:hypothetical protein [Micromonospora sp. NPDC047730]|uniref:hypothetical protein n=1 Tax=Micromonospora sp. NPDC047730 TaxID=3364253 RepID=UPI00372323C9